MWTSSAPLCHLAGPGCLPTGMACLNGLDMSIMSVLIVSIVLLLLNLVYNLGPEATYVLKIQALCVLRVFVLGWVDALLTAG